MEQFNNKIYNIIKNNRLALRKIEFYREISKKQFEIFGYFYLLIFLDRVFSIFKIISNISTN